MPVIAAIGATASYALYGALASTAIAAAGTGLSYYSSQQQANTAQRMANYNAAVEQQNANIQTKLAQYQYGVNARAAEAEAQARLNTAAGIENQVAGVEAQQREQARRRREDNEKMLSLQRAKFAKAGVVAEGSPLIVLSEQAKLAEMNVQDEAYQSDLQRTDLFHRAALERFRAGFSLLDAGQERYKGAAATVGGRIAKRQADITRMSGGATAQALRGQGAASLISNLGSTGFSAASALR